MSRLIYGTKGNFRQSATSLAMLLGLKDQKLHHAKIGIFIRKISILLLNKGCKTQQKMTAVKEMDQL